MAAYYNEIDPYAAEWLRTLIMMGHIADGEVDTRSISEVTPNDLRGFTQCHFFAGIGVWSRALRIAGWDDSRPVWTGSCPCQPFSVAGRAGGFSDERHLWPHWHHLIRECRPRVVFGEQVASKDGLNWLDLVHSDMEGEGYAFSAVDLCAAGVGAPHIRQRLYFVADDCHAGSQGGLYRGPHSGRRGRSDGDTPRHHGEIQIEGLGAHGELAYTDSERLDGQHTRLCGQDIYRRKQDCLEIARDGEISGRPGPVNGYWRDADWLYCRDDKWRPVESGTFPLAHGAPARVGRLRAYGNAIVPQVAAAMIGAYMDVRDTQE